MNSKPVLLFGLFLLIGAGCLGSDSSEISLGPSVAGNQAPVIDEEISIADKSGRISTVRGDIVFRLFDETAPLAVTNFIKLSEEKFYHGLTFHELQPRFVIYGGDPDGDGTGGPGYEFIDEIDEGLEFKRGIVAMSNRGPDTNGSQFFILMSDVQLPKTYTILGEVTSGMNVVDSLEVGDLMLKVAVEELN